MAKKTSRKKTARKTALGKEAVRKVAGKKKTPAPGRARKAAATPRAKKASQAPVRQVRGLRPGVAPRELIAPPFLGHPSAVTIVCACANTIPANLGRTLQQLGVAGGPFHICVFSSVTTAGYTIVPGAIPNDPGATLIAVVNRIQGAPRAR